MKNGTRWHAIRPIVPLSIIAGVRARKIKQQRNRPRATACHGDLYWAWTPLHANGHRPEIPVTCPKCGETRLIERVDRQRWFCAVCAHSWTSGATNDGTNSWSMCRLALPPAPNDPAAFTRRIREIACVAQPVSGSPEEVVATEGEDRSSQVSERDRSRKGTSHGSDVQCAQAGMFKGSLRRKGEPSSGEIVGGSASSL
jgi:hypothetical protein